MRGGEPSRDHDGGMAGSVGNAVGAAGGALQARRGIQALGAARPRTDGSARDLEATQAARTTLDGARTVTSGASGIASRVAPSANFGTRPADGISLGADPARVTRAANVVRGLERAGGALRLGQGGAPLASATPAGRVIGAARTGFEVGAEGDRLSGERGTVRDDQGAPVTTSQWAGDDAARIRRERGGFAGAGALVGSTVVAGTVAVREYGPHAGRPRVERRSA